MNAPISPALQPSGRARSHAVAWWACGLALLGSLYNMLLALVNAHGPSMNFAIVSATEIGIVGLGLLVVALSGFRRTDIAPLGLLLLFVAITLLLTMVNGSFVLEPVRNIATIAIFTMLGARATRQTIVTTFVVLAGVTLAVLILEIVSTEAYVALLQPGNYLQNTRGIAIKDWDDSGLFSAAHSFKGRFSFGLSDHRTSSVFLEQVSLANLAAVLAIALIALWERLSRRARLLLVVTLVLIVLTNDARVATFLVLTSAAGYFIYPLLPRYGSIALPIIALALAFAMILIFGPSSADDLQGRVSRTYEHLVGLQPAEYFGIRLNDLRYWDSGFAFSITAYTLIGFAALLAFMSMLSLQISPAQKRTVYGVAMYFAVNLVVSGTSLYSIKTAAPLWLLMGYMAAHGAELPRRHRHRTAMRTPYSAGPLVLAGGAAPARSSGVTTPPSTHLRADGI